MIRIKNFIFSDFQENTYVLSDESNNCIIVDPGCFNWDEQQELLNYLCTGKLSLQKIVFTHCHIDHVFGAGFLSRTFPEAGLFAHKLESMFISHNSAMAAMFGISMKNPPALTGFLTEGDPLRFGNSELQILHTPGHSPGSLCYYHQAQGFILAGDVLFCGSIGRADLPGSDMETLLESIRGKLFTLPGDVNVLCGHGPATTIAREKQHNPFVGNNT